MIPPRRSQRLCTQPTGPQNGHTQKNGEKRKHANEEKCPEVKRKRYRLTEKNLSELRKQENRAMGRTRKTPSDSSRASTTNTTTTDRRFGPNLIQNGVVFVTSLTQPPSDYDEIKTALAQKRNLPASAHRDFQGIRDADIQMTFSELSLESKVIESMLVHHDHPAFYQRFRNDQWTEVENEITAGMSDPKPDVSEAYSWTAYPPRTKEEFEDLVPTQYGYAMPTFAMETKGTGDAGQAVRQAAYDGAIMTHAAIAAEGQMNKDEGSLYSKTKAITVTLTPTEICVYANHAIKDQSTGKITYHHHRVERVPYLDSEMYWNSAYGILHNAQAFALSLANSRIQDLRKYFEEKDAQLGKMKTKHGKLQADARVKTKANMGHLAPSSKGVSGAETDKALPRNAANTARPTTDRIGTVDQETPPSN